MATIDPSEAQANAQALADSFAQQADADGSGYPGAPGDDPVGNGEENPGKRKFDGEADFAGAKRGSYNGPDTNGVSSTAHGLL